MPIRGWPPLKCTPWSVQEFIGALWTPCPLLIGAHFWPFQYWGLAPLSSVPSCHFASATKHYDFVIAGIPLPVPFVECSQGCLQVFPLPKGGSLLSLTSFARCGDGPWLLVEWKLFYPFRASGEGNISKPFANSSQAYWPLAGWRPYWAFRFCAVVDVFTNR